jgi:FkbM family methyltransferase
MSRNRTSSWITDRFRYSSVGRAVARLRNALSWRRRIRQAEEQRIFGHLKTVVVQDIVCRVPSFGFVYRMDPRSRLFLRMLTQGDYEPEAVKLCKSLIDPTTDLIDVGANIGFYSVLFASRLSDRRVLAIEPTENAFARLRHNLDSNGVADRVLLCQGVATDVSGKRTLATIAGEEEFSSLDAITHPAASTNVVHQSVPSYTLDELVARYALAPGLIKIDAEGSELLVLRGARNTLQKYRPVIFSELSDPLLRSKGGSAAAVIDLLRDCGYVVSDPFHSEGLPGSREYGEILAVHSER